MSQREHQLLEDAWQELFEDHLGVALIKPGDSVTIRKKWYASYAEYAIRVEPR